MMRPQPRLQGFAALDRDRRREIASKGGRAVHEKGTARVFTIVEARKAGRLGGLKVSRDREHMSSIGRRGGRATSLLRSKASSVRPHEQLSLFESEDGPDAGS